MRRLPLLAALVASAAFSAITARAGAQTVVASEPPTRREPLRADTQQPLWISQSDCLAGDTLTFTVTVTDGAGKLLEVWIGDTSCVDADGGAIAKSCVQLQSTSAPATSTPIIVKVQDMVANRSGGTAADCAQQVGGGGDAKAVTLHFVLVDPATGSPVAAASDSWSTKIDLVGPPAPEDVVAKRGEGSLSVTWTKADATDVDHYHVYCDPDAVAVDGGDCSSTLASGTAPASDAPTCQLLAPTSDTRVTVPDLTNLQLYGVAVAASDTVGNFGPLSLASCGTPTAVEDFFEAYRQAGGQAGGGCTLTSSHASALLPLSALLVLWTLRAQRRRSARRFRGAR